MGQPASTPEEAIREIALAALNPNKVAVTPQLVRESGLHREMLQSIYDALEPEIKNLVGWKPLGEFVYFPDWREHSTEDEKKGEKLTKTWREYLSSPLQEMELSHLHAIIIFDGERLPVPAPDYRLFLLRDGRLLYYKGGFHAGWSPKPPVCGDLMTILDTLEAVYPARPSSMYDTEPFVLLAKLLSKTLEMAVKKREDRAAAQKKLHQRIQESLGWIGAKSY
jgi:hypothetical protein